MGIGRQSVSPFSISHFLIMHIVVNALLVHGEFSGVQHAILHQLRALLNLEVRHRYTILAVQDSTLEVQLGNTVQPYTVLRTPLHSGQRVRRILWEQMMLPKVLDHEDAELLYSPGYLTSLRWRGPSVAFIHDTIALSHPQLCTRGNAWNYRALLPPSARRATLVAVPSQASAQDVARYCRVAPSRIRVVPLGVEMPPPFTDEVIAAARAQIGLQDPYLLAVSTIEPKKNFDSLIRWFDFWKTAGIPHHLVIIGKWGWGCHKVARALARSRYREQIHLPGYLPQSQLPAIMAEAAMLLMPSRYEGFGLPALEAMAAGTPVVVSDRGALPETVGDAGLVIPLDSVFWRAEIPTLLNYPDRLQTMREAGKAWASTHTWRRTAENLLCLFHEATGLDAPVFADIPVK
ncbi:MAG: glycosyltransferase family 4 protein [Armatimonadota bacterium]